MKATASLFLLIVLPIALFAQAPVVVSTSPADNAVNVPTSTTTFSITFDAAVDTLSFKLSNDGGPSGGLMTSLDSLKSLSFSADYKTLYISGKISAGKPYFILLYYAKRKGGSALTVPYGFRFTTAASFPTLTVSGTVTTGTSGVSPAYAIVALNGGPVTDKADFRAGAVADGAGAFTIPYVSNGTYYPVAAKALNTTGMIDPSLGDPIAISAPITVSGLNISGLILPLQGPQPMRFARALDSLNAHLASLPSPRVLRRVEGQGIDSTGAARNWRFEFTGTSRQGSFEFRVEQFGARWDSMDAGTYSWITNWSPIASLPAAAVVDSFLARAERGGGNAYRPKPMSWDGFDAHLQIGDVYWGEFWQLVSDSSKLYLGMGYQYYYQPNPNQYTMIKQRLILGDYGTGNVLSSSGVAADPLATLPAQFELKQNFPNPFNPTTIISCQLPIASHVKLAVYDLLGREVAVLVDGELEAGSHAVTFSAGTLSSGVYLYRLTAGSFTETRRMLLVR